MKNGSSGTCAMSGSASPDVRMAAPLVIPAMVEMALKASCMRRRRVRRVKNVFQSSGGPWLAEALPWEREEAASRAALASAARSAEAGDLALRTWCVVQNGRALEIVVVVDRVLGKRVFAVALIWMGRAVVAMNNLGVVVVLWRSRWVVVLRLVATTGDGHRIMAVLSEAISN